MAQSFRVFVSSTFQDLQEYRSVLLNAVLDAGAVPVLLDEKIGIGEAIEPKTRELIDSADAVLLLVGHRYGSVNTTTGKSWVETEYEAVRRRQKPVLAFLAAEDASWPLKLVDTDRERVDQFRRRIAADLAVRLFSTSDQLRRAATEALTQFVYANSPKTRNNDAVPIHSREVRIVRLLLSSPGDVDEERERVARAVFRFNQNAVEELGIFIKLVRWEDMAPQIGPKAQTVINKQIGEYHLFCGIMWNRFGTPTEIAASGTKEEFDAAIACWESKARPWITFYFCDRPAAFTTPEQLDQKRSVLELRSQLYDKGVVRSFMTPVDFEDLVYEDLKRIVKHPDFLHMIDSH